MISHTTSFRVRYDETDQMGVVNNAQYASYFEIGRSEFFRSIGIDYVTMEKEGFMLPVAELYVKYIRPAHYDEVLSVKTILNDVPAGRLRFDYEIYNESGVLITEGYTLLAFINSETRRPCRVPTSVKEALRSCF